MAKANQKGRSQNEPFVCLHRGITSSTAWKSLKVESRALLLEIWIRHNGKNNGRIALGHHQAREALRIGSRKVTAAFKELQNKGFIIMRLEASFDWKTGAGEGRATEWELTAEPCDGNSPKRYYKNWKN